MPTITIRLDNDLLEKINQSKGENTVSAYCKTLISDSLNNPVHDVHISKENENIKIELQHKTDMLKMCTERTQDLKRQIEDMEETKGLLIHEIEDWKKISNNILYPTQEEINKKSWWQFWK
jgi:hypothetical protein